MNKKHLKLTNISAIFGHCWFEHPNQDLIKVCLTNEGTYYKTQEEVTVILQKEKVPCYC